MLTNIDPSNKIFYIDPLVGSDNNSGTNIDNPWKTLNKISIHHSETPFNPGDKILLKSGSFFKETLMLRELHGTENDPITLSWYNTSSDQQLKRPVLSPAPLRQQSIQFKNCSFIQLENLEIRQGKLYFTFGNLTNQPTTKTIFDNFSIKNLYMHNIYSGDSSKASLEFNVLGKNIVVKNIKIENCEFEGIACHAILLNTSHLIQPDNNKEHFENVTITNNKIRNTSDTALILNYVNKGIIEKNTIINAGKFLTSALNNKGSSGITIDSCSNINICKNEIRSCFGETRSTALCLLKNNNTILLKYNICKDNVGGFISIFGGNSNILIQHNISFNDGFRTKQASSLTSTHGRTVILSDFSKWSYTENQNIHQNITNLNISKNVFTTNFVDKPVTLALFGKHNQIHIEENTVMCRVPNNIQIITNDAIQNLIIKNNISNVPWNIPNQQNCNLTITNNKIKEFDVNIEAQTPVQNEPTFEDSLFAFLEKLNNDNLIHSDLDFLELFQKQKNVFETKNKNSTKTKKPKLFCMFCYAPRKMACLMAHLIKNKEALFLNEILAHEFKTSPWEITSWFSDPSRILHNTTAKQTLDLIDDSEHRALISLLQYISSTIKNNSVLLLGEQFVMSGTEIFNYFHEEMDNCLEINSVFLVDNIYDDAKFKLSKRIESAPLHEIKNLDINLYISHCSSRFFSQIETLMGLLYTQLGPDRFFSVDFQQHIIYNTFNSFWKMLSRFCPTNFKHFFKQLSKSNCSDYNLIFDEQHIDFVFLSYIVKDVKLKSIEQQKNEILEIKNLQKKYNLQTERHSALNINKESSETCKTHCANLEKLGGFKYFGNAAFFYEDTEFSADFIKTIYYKLDLQQIVEV